MNIQFIKDFFIMLDAFFSAGDAGYFTININVQCLPWNTARVARLVHAQRVSHDASLLFQDEAH
jgi:hypothetical protein